MNNNGQDIRFINSHYNELFRIPDGGIIEVKYPDREFSARCEYLDDYHTKISGEVYHICQFAEILERGGGICQPEPEIPDAEAAWRIGYRNYLTVQRRESGWDYTVYDKDLHEVDGGRLDRPELTMPEARESVLENHGLENRSRFREDYEFVMERAEEVLSEGVDERASDRTSTLETLSAPKQTEADMRGGGDGPHRRGKEAR